ncbi:MAG: AAA family ATPase, partial [Lentisphaeria bacterium]|nr:AAA family ATPase [Lentisphaeria bacterium]
MAFEQKAGEQRPAGILPDRAQPHDPEVEKAVLAAMLREPESCVDTVIMFLHDADVFYSHIHREIYQVIRELHDDNSKAVDLVTISHELQTKGKLDAVGGNAYLAELYNAISTTVNIEAWCNILKKYAILRRMIDVCSGALGKCYDSGADAASLVEEIENDIYKVRGEEAANNIVELKDIIKDEFQSLMSLLEDNAEAGISTGYAAIDKMTGGLKPGEMFVLAARPSIGKTSLALNVIANVALKKYTPRPRKVAFFSLEMTSSQITRRLLCSEAGVPESVFWNKTFNHADLTKFTSAASEFYNASIF